MRSAALHSRTGDAAWATALLLCASLSIASAPWALGVPALNFVFKPLATAVLIAYAWRRGAGQPLQRRWVLLGLGFSWLGDVCLMWPQQGFLPGLVSFLLAHGCYLVAFTRGEQGARLAARPWAFGVYAVLAATVLSQLWPGVPAALRAPVVVYVAALAAMAAQAAVLWRLGRPRGAVLAAGGALFLCSDALLATNKFAAPLPAASLWILATYWAAQWCIVSWLAPADAATTAGSPPAR